MMRTMTLALLVLAAPATAREDEANPVDRYFDAAVGVMKKNAEGKVAITRVTLRPEVVFSGEQRPTRADLDRLHHKAHEECYIANSVKSELLCEPVWRD